MKIATHIKHFNKGRSNLQKVSSFQNKTITRFYSDFNTQSQYNFTKPQQTKQQFTFQPLTFTKLLEKKHYGTAYSKIVNEAKEKAQNEPDNKTPDEEYTLKHPIWSDYEVQEVMPQFHRTPVEFKEKLAATLVKIMKNNFDIMSGFKFGERNPNKWLTRIIFLETVAGVPGSIGATLRHLTSLRKMQRDHGWIHTLLEEAENERMHLLTALELKNPSLFFRICVLITQGIFYNFFFTSYLLSPKFCHRFVGYLEEEAVKTYTRCLADIDDPNSKTSVWAQTPAPEIARKYWKLKDNATMRDVVLVIRADEAHHRNVNHRFGDLKSDDVNPFGLGR